MTEVLLPTTSRPLQLSQEHPPPTMDLSLQLQHQLQLKTSTTTTTEPTQTTTTQTMDQPAPQTQTTTQTQPDTQQTTTQTSTTTTAQQTTTNTTTTTTTKKIHTTETFPYTCPMCLEEFQERRQLYRVVGCRHLYCQPCVVAYYSQNIKDHKAVVKCPDPSCTTEILFCNVKNLLDNAVLLQYQRIALKSPLNQTKHSSIWCPGANCKNKIFRQKTNKIDANTVMCTKCKLRVCFKCGEWEHPGVVCDEAEVLTDKKIQSENETKEAFEEWKKKEGVTVKSCPKCGALIERNGGCSHMTCRSCTHQFCFMCLVPTKQTHCR